MRLLNKIPQGTTVCPDCGLPIVTYSDWGDYDDACEWACTCKEWEIPEMEE